MKVALGLYTTLYSAPSSLFDRTLSLVYEPILSYMYNKPGNHMALYQSSMMMKHLKRERQEYKTLIALFMKRGDIEPITGSWSESVLSLLPPKDRGSQIEKLTSEIRHEYGLLPGTAFFYGEVWQPYYITLLNNAGIDNVVIAGEPSSSPGESSPFVMNELGKRVNIYPFSDSAAAAVREYAEGKTDYQSLRSRILTIIHESNGDTPIFLNIDQLVFGSQRENSSIKPGTLVCDIFDRFQTVPVTSILPSRNGYLQQGWYGRDSFTYSLQTVNSLFVRNASFRYLYNRYISTAESAQLRNNRFLKKDVTTALFNTSLGTLFIHDSELSPMRYSSHRAFWQALIDAENCFRRYTDGPSIRECDYEECGKMSQVMSNKSYLAVISPLGGSVSEFDYLPLSVNYFDTRPAFREDDYSSPLKKSFEDIITVNGEEWSTSSLVFTPEIVDKKRSEIVMTPPSGTLPFLLSKRYKLKANTFTLDSTLSPVKGGKLSGSYRVSIYLTFPDGVLLLPEQRMDMMAKGSVEAKTVKYGSKEAGASLVVSSVEAFKLTEENRTVSFDTAVGEEEFVLYKKITFEFPLEVSSGESVTYRLNIRDISNK